MSAVRAVLPPAAYAAALAALDAATPSRLRVLLDRREPQAAWRLVLDGRLSDEPRLGSSVNGTDLAARWRDAARSFDVAALWARCRALGLAVTIHGQPDYPAALANDRAAPAVLFWLGDIGSLARQRAAIVGTRNATLTGRDIARRFGRELAEAGVGVVSGLATGIDTAAHQGALQAAGSLPIGVVGSGHDVVYPPANRSLWSKMAESGVLLAEVPPGTQPLAYRFPLRNRIIAALSEVVVVVESRAAGGSMHTVDQAARRGVPVLAVPGSLNNRAAEGTNRLISEGCQPATDVADVLMAMGLERSGQMRFPVDRRPRPNSADAAVLDLIGTDPVPIDRLVEASGRSVVDVALSLGRLEADGWVLCTGGWFERVHDGVAGR